MDHNMPFVKIGDQWFNPNLVTDIRLRKDGEYTLYFSAPEQKREGPGERVIRARSLTFRGDQAEIFEQWLSEHEEDPFVDNNGSSGSAAQDRVGF